MINANNVAEKIPSREHCYAAYHCFDYLQVCLESLRIVGRQNEARERVEYLSERKLVPVLDDMGETPNSFPWEC